jgi:cobalt/nickel transport system permease protein
LSAAAILSAVAGLELGALCVTLQTLLSGVTELPFGTFVALMLPIHLVIGLIEGIVTAAALCFVYKMRPEIIESAQSRKRLGGISIKGVLILLAAITIIAGGVLSLLSSAKPDGLEWAVGKTMEQTSGTGSAIESGSGAESGAAGTSTAGIIGAAVTFVIAGTTGLIISLVKKRRSPEANA